MSIKYIIFLILFTISWVIIFNKIRFQLNDQLIMTNKYQLNELQNEPKIEVYYFSIITDGNFRTGIISFLLFALLNITFSLENIYRYCYFQDQTFKELLLNLLNAVKNLYLRSNISSFFVIMIVFFKFALSNLLYGLNKIFNRSLKLVFTKDFYDSIINIVDFLIIVPFLFSVLTILIIYISGKFVDREKVMFSIDSYFKLQIFREYRENLPFYVRRIVDLMIKNENVTIADEKLEPIHFSEDELHKKRTIIKVNDKEGYVEFED